MKTLTLTVAILALAGCQAPKSDNSEAPTASTPGATNTQKFTITVDNGFSPETLEVKAGVPVEITFDTIHRSCATEVIFEGMDLKTSLTEGQKSVLTFPAKPAGTYKYACPMNMLTGKIVAR
jgi:P-type Cu+ transporter